MHYFSNTLLDSCIINVTRFYLGNNLLYYNCIMFPFLYKTIENTPIFFSLRYDHPNGLNSIHICVFYQKNKQVFSLKCDIYYAFTFKP